MARYENGRAPLSALVRFDDQDDHWLPLATARKLAALVRLVEERHGVTLYVTEGPNGYRWYDAQVRMRAEKCAIGRCDDAAWPGTSPHGLEVRGEDVAAFDIDNWGVIGRDAFYQACRDVGLEPGTVSWEPWHVIDGDPWAEVPAEDEEDDMKEDERLALFQIRQLLTETDQWMGVIKTLGEVYRIVGVTQQILTETAQWDGIDTRVSQIKAAVQQLTVDVATASSGDAARDAALSATVKALASGSGVDPDGLAKIVTDAAAAGSARALLTANLPTSDQIAQAVLTEQQKARLAQLEVEAARAREDAETLRVKLDQPAA